VAESDDDILTQTTSGSWVSEMGQRLVEVDPFRSFFLIALHVVVLLHLIELIVKEPCQPRAFNNLSSSSHLRVEKHEI